MNIGMHDAYPSLYAPDLTMEANAQAFFDTVHEFVPEILQSAGAQANLAHLTNLNDERQVKGFTGEQWQEVSYHLLATEYPLQNIRTITQRPNERHTHDWLASWHHRDHDLSFYDLHYEGRDTRDKAETLRTAVHELGHMVSPFVPDNNNFYGNRESRYAAAYYISSVAEQSLFTGVHLTNYHKSLMEEFIAIRDKAAQALHNKTIDQTSHDNAVLVARSNFYEETGAILHEMVLANRGGLDSVEALQHRVWEKRAIRNHQVQNKPVPPKVNLLTHTDPTLFDSRRNGRYCYCYIARY